MDALGVVVVDGLVKQASQMAFTEHHHVIEKLSPNAADEALRRPVLPWASERRAPGTDAEARDRGGDFGGEDRVVVEDQESMRRVNRMLRLAAMIIGVLMCSTGRRRTASWSSNHS